MEPMHSLLKRQISYHLGSPDSLPKDLQPFIAAVNDAYVQFDADRTMLEHTRQLIHTANSEVRAVYERLIDSSVEGIFAFDRQCCYTVWNPAMEGIFGLSDWQTLRARPGRLWYRLANRPTRGG
jgi:PAS domain-containing protein